MADNLSVAVLWTKWGREERQKDEGRRQKDEGRRQKAEG
jgi:hypothetical protein